MSHMERYNQTSMNSFPYNTVPRPPTRRARLNGKSLEILMEEFQKCPNPSPEIRKLIANRVNIAERSVRIWFQNRRAKIRKSEKLKNYQYNYSEDQYYDGKDLGKCISLIINPEYYFIQSKSISVGHWERIKQDCATNYMFAPKLDDLLPLSVEELMEDPLDLAVILLQKNRQLNYIFTSVSHEEKVIFRIYYSLLSVESCTLTSIPANAPTDSKPLNSEITLFLNKPPQFAVYFTRTFNLHSGPDTWTVAEDFSIDHQVKNAFVGPGGKNIPHRVVGRTLHLDYLHKLINSEKSAVSDIGYYPAYKEPLISDTSSSSLSYNFNTGFQASPQLNGSLFTGISSNKTLDSYLPVNKLPPLSYPATPTNSTVSTSGVPDSTIKATKQVGSSWGQYLPPLKQEKSYNGGNNLYDLMNRK